MPHVILKLAAGRSQQTKLRIAEALTKAVMATADVEEAAVSVSIEDVAPKDWTEKVYKPEILGRPETLYKPPGYAPR